MYIDQELIRARMTERSRAELEAITSSSWEYTPETVALAQAELARRPAAEPEPHYESDARPWLLAPALFLAVCYAVLTPLTTWNLRSAHWLSNVAQWPVAALAAFAVLAHMRRWPSARLLLIAFWAGMALTGIVPALFAPRDWWSSVLTAWNQEAMPIGIAVYLWQASKVREYYATLNES